MAPPGGGKSNEQGTKLLLEGAKIIDFCLSNLTVEGAWIDQKAQKLFGPHSYASQNKYVEHAKMEPLVYWIAHTFFTEKTLIKK